MPLIGLEILTIEGQARTVADVLKHSTSQSFQQRESSEAPTAYQGRFCYVECSCRPRIKAVYSKSTGVEGISAVESTTNTSTNCVAVHSGCDLRSKINSGNSSTTYTHQRFFEALVCGGLVYLCAGADSSLETMQSGPTVHGQFYNPKPLGNQRGKVMFGW